MRRIVHHELGEPARVLRVEDGPSPSLGPDHVRVRLSYAPIHPGDLLGIMGSPAFGTPPTIALAQRLAQEGGTLFQVAERYLPSRIADAVTHASQASRAGVVLIDFSQH